MQADQIRHILLRLLQCDSEVQDAVRLVLQPEASPMLAPCTPAEEALIGSRALLPDEDAASERIAQKDRELDALRRQQAQMQDVMATYARLERVYSDYLTLPAFWRGEIGAILNDSSPLSFAVTCASREVVSRLHALISEHWARCSPQELAVLNACFDLVFDLFLLGKPDYRRIVTHEGERFDPAQHRLLPGCSPEQRIVQVIIAGVQGEQLFAPSLVRTGEYGMDALPAK